MTAKLLVIDNYDSFTFNLVQMFRRYELDISVFRADALSVEDVVGRRPDYILVSPGPKSPSLRRHRRSGREVAHWGRFGVAGENA